MGKIAHNLLSIGEINAKSVTPDSPFPPSSSSPFEIRKHSLPGGKVEGEEKIGEGEGRGEGEGGEGEGEGEGRGEGEGGEREGEGGEGEGEGRGNGGVIKDEKPSNESDTPKELSPPTREGGSIVTSGHIPPDKGSTSPDVTVCDVATPLTISQSSDEEVGVVSTALGELSLEPSKLQKPGSGEAGPVVSSGETTSPTSVGFDRLTAISNVSSKEAGSHSQSPVLQSNTNQSESHDSMETTPLQPSLELSGPLTADSDGLSQRWYITFEQFISSVQTEPELCQFFAEQNTIDLDSSSVDPLLTPYTRTVLIHR